MNGMHIIRNVMWKEYRLQRAFWIAMAVVSVFAQISIVWSFATFSNWGGTLAGLVFYGSVLIAEVCTAFYAVGCTATLFATEHETGTFAFQKQLPVSAPRLVWGKVLFAAISTACMFAFLILTAFVLATHAKWWRPGPISSLNKDFWPLLTGGLGLAILEAMAWGIFYSLLVRRPLLAAILAIVTASQIIEIVFFSNSLFARENYYIKAVSCRLLFLAAVVVADVWLGFRWFREESWWAKWRSSHAGRNSMRSFVAIADAKPTVYSPSSGFAPLCWQHIRQSRGFFITIICLFFLFSFPLYPYLFRSNHHQPVKYDPYDSLLNPLILLLIPIWGVLVFHADQKAQSFRFIAERGFKPHIMWLSRQVPGFLPLMLAALIYFILFVLMLQQIKQNWEERFRFDLEMFWGQTPSLGAAGICFVLIVGYAILAYSAGQFCSLFFPSGILAGFFSLLFTLLLALWSYLMIFWGVPWWWSIAPLPILLLLATWLRMPGWLLERNDLRAWLRPGVVLIPFLAVFIAMPFYRVYSVPWVDPGFSEEEFLRSPTPEAIETARLYQQAWEEYIPYPSRPPAESSQDAQQKDGEEERSEPKTPNWSPPPSLTEEGRNWIKSNTKALELAIKASQRSECNFSFNTSPNNSTTQIVARFGSMFIDNARLLAADGKIADSWQSYLAAFHIIDQMNKNKTDLNQWMYLLNLQKYIYEHLPFWAANKDVTQEQIQVAIKELKNRVPNSSPYRVDLVRRYLHMRALAQGNDKRGTSFESNKKQSVDSILWLWRFIFPWEQYRAERLLNGLLKYEFRTWDGFDFILANNRYISHFQISKTHYEPAFALRSEVVLVEREFSTGEYQQRMVVNLEALRRATIIQLALVEWKKSHGSYPSYLTDVKEILGDELPRDPYSGQDYQYLEKGLSSPQQINYKSDTRILEAGHPFIWCPSEWDYEGHNNVNILYSNGHVFYTPRTQQEIWSRGITYPLP